jgi:integrase
LENEADHMSEELRVSLRTAAGIRALLAHLLLTHLGSLPADYDKVHFDSDLPGYGLRVRGTGVHSLMVQYAIAGQSRRVVIGKFGSIDPGKAYNTGKDLLARVRLGRDPAAEKEHARARAAETFGALLPRFLDRQKAKQKPRSYEETERHLTTHCKTFYRIAVEGLTRRTIGARLAEIEKRSGPAAANRVRASLSAYFTWLAREGYVDANPVAFTNKAVENGARERVLSDDELRIIWRALDDGMPSNPGEPSDHYRAILKLLLLTGARRDEIGGLCWSEVDIDDATVTLPSSRTKSRREHIIPLSESALQILAVQPRRTNPDGTPRDHVFGIGLDRGYSGWSKSKAELDARITKARHGKALDWRPHDFRRSLSTALHGKRFKVPPHIVEVILGHVSGHKAGVAGTYNKAIYLDERRDALERWGAHVTSIVSGKPPMAKVVRLRRIRAESRKGRTGGR